jgi:HlyD family secretion protein
VKNKKRTKKVIIGGIVMLAIAGLGVWGYSVFAKSETGRYTEAAVDTGTLVNDNRFTGVIESQSRETITATSAQKISDLYVAKGDWVEKDDELYKTAAGDVISATKSGEVGEINFDEDKAIAAGDKVMEIVDYENLKVSIKVDEYQLSSIAVGQPVTITIDSIGRSIQGTVSEISREAKNENGVAYFTATVDFTGDAQVRIGMNAEVIVVKEQAANALTVPVDAILFDGGNNPYVMVKIDDETTENRQVTTGITDGVKIQITQGVSAGETILIPVATTAGTTTFQRSNGNSN